MSALRTTFKCLKPCSPSAGWLAAVLLCAALPPTAQAQTTPLSNVSVDDLVSRLSSAEDSSGLRARSFRRTEAPDADTHLCAGMDSTRGASTSSRNFAVVGYAPDGAAQVDLDVRFEYAADRLTSSDRSLLDTLARALNNKALRDARFALAGHTDASGSERINLELSCARAIAVRNYLLSHGIAADRLSAYGFGSSRLLDAGNPTAAINRRVEVRRAGS